MLYSQEKNAECTNKQHHLKKTNSFVGLLYHKSISHFQLDIKIIHMKHLSARGTDPLLKRVAMPNFGDSKYYIGKFWYKYQENDKC